MHIADIKKIRYAEIKDFDYYGGNKMTDVEEFFAEQMKNPEFKQEYDALQEEFSNAAASIKQSTDNDDHHR